MFPLSSKAEDPVILGLRGALNAITPVPTDTLNAIRTMAAETLARYVKPVNGSLLAERKSGTKRVWMEMKGLQLTQVTAKAMSQADQANGVLECYIVFVNCEMYRNYDTVAAKWSDWYNGRNPFMPTAIYVERNAADQWTSRLPGPTNLIAQHAKGDPKLISHAPNPPQRPVLTQASAPQSSPALKAQPIPPPAKIRVPTTPINSPAKSITPPDEPRAKWTGMIVLFTILAAFSAIVNSIKPKKGSRKRGSSKRAAFTSPPPVSSQTASPQPPPLPASPFTQASNPIDLMQPKETLMTQAELAFFAVLHPIVNASCMISSKVRLADLFEVRQERGQQAAFNKISSKHIDFVLIESGSSRILCGIELDDSSHKRPDRMDRDDFVNELFATHGMPLLRVPVAWTYNVPGLRSELLKAGVPLANAV